MKTKSFAVIVSGTAVVALCLLGARFPQTSKAQTESAPAPAPDVSPAQVVPDNPPALPPGVYPSSPLAQVIKLIQAGVSGDVIMAYVTNSGSTFNLDPDKIIYMKDIGAPDELVTAMIQRDQVLKAQMATAYQPPPQPAPATEPAPTETVVEQPAPVTVNYFYDTLAPYGNWVFVEGYGRCWRPTVTVINAGWQPYCDHGHWIYTDGGWYWLSDYSWGWAAFHYGRWFHHARFGWCWYPDTVWGPSWVTWRYSDDYCGWAPLPPGCVYREGFGFFYNGGIVSVGFDFGLSMDWFTFVRIGDFCDPHPWRHRIEPRAVTQIYSHTTVINNINMNSQNRTFINHGIDPDRITAVTRKEIRPVAIHETTTPVARGEQLGHDGRTLMVNRPHFTDNLSPSNRGPAPHAAPPSPVVGSPYQPSHNGNEDNNSQSRRNQPASSTPMLGQRQIPPAITPGSPGRNEMTPPAEHSSSPGNRYVPATPVQPSAPNYGSADNRRYPSPRMNPGSSGGSAAAPVTPTSPPVRQPEPNHYTPAAQPPAPAQPPQRNYVSPRNETPPSESRPNYSQPPAQGNQSHAAPAPSSPPAQSQQSQQSQGSGRDKDKNGR
jgi:hypothetical protein